jgi:hypothetical protein
MRPFQTTHMTKAASIFFALLLFLTGIHPGDGNDAGKAADRPADLALVSPGQAGGGPFYLEKYEVTNARYQRFVEETGYESEGDWKKYFGEGTVDFPVRGVTFNDAAAYAAHVGRRLPTEAEWRLASRTLGRGALPGGRRGAAIEDLEPVKVGSGKPNSLGVYDLEGNVSEWCVTPSSVPGVRSTGAALGSSYFHTENAHGGQLLPLYLCGFRCAEDFRDTAGPLQAGPSNAAPPGESRQARSGVSGSPPGSGRVFSGAGGTGNAAPRPHGFSMRGSNTLEVNSTGTGTELADRTEMALDWGSIRAGILAELSHGTGEAGSGSPNRLSELYMEWKDSFQGDNLKLQLRGGTVTNLTAASGLLVGATRFHGAHFRMADEKLFNVDVFGGKAETWRPSRRSYLESDDYFYDPELTEDWQVDSGNLGGLRISRGFFKALDLGFTYLQLFPDGAPSRGSMGFDYSLRTRYFRSAAEYAGLGRDGRGFYFNVQSDFIRRLNLRFEHRNYRNFYLPVNNPPIYSGVSGGNDEDEIGYLFAAEFTPLKKTTLGVGVNFSSRQDGSDAMTDTMFLVRRELFRGFSAEYGLEHEDAEGQTTIIHSAMVSYAAKNGLRGSLRLISDQNERRALRTVRVNFRYPFFHRKFTPFLSYTFRREDTLVQNDPQAGFILKFLHSQYLTVRYTKSDGPGGGLSVTLFSEF